MKLNFANVNAERSKAVLFFTRNDFMKQHINKKEILEQIIPVVENTAIRYNLIPIEVSFEKENGAWFLRIFIFSTDHEVTHLDCGHVSDSIGDFLDQLIPFKYYLEVSSPGLNRKIKSEKEYLYFKDKNAIIKLNEPVDETGEKKFDIQILDYMENSGIKIRKISTGEDYFVPFENIVGTQLNDI